MKNILIITFLLFGLIVRAQEVFEASVCIDLTDRRNAPFYAYNNEVPTLLLKAFNEGKIQGYHYRSNSAMDKNELANKTISYFAFDDQYLFEELGKLPIYNFYRDFRLLKLEKTVSKESIEKNQIPTLWETITICTPSSYYGKAQEIISFRFDEAVNVLNNSKQKYYHPYNNADSLKLGDALKKHRFSIVSACLSEWDNNQYLCESLSDETITIEKSEESNIPETYFEKILSSFREPMSPSYTIPLLTQESANIKKFKVIEHVPLNKYLNSPYYQEGKELSQTILKAALNDHISIYKNDSLTDKMGPSDLKELLRLRHLFYYDDFLEGLEMTPLDSNDPAYFYTGQDLYLVKITKNIVTKGTDIINESVQAISLSIPPDHHLNADGFSFTVASFDPIEIAQLLKEEKITWYNPLNNADSASLAQAFLNGRYHIYELHVIDVFGNDIAYHVLLPDSTWRDYFHPYNGDLYEILPGNVLSDTFPDKEYQSLFISLSAYHSHFSMNAPPTPFISPKSVRNKYFKGSIYRLIEHNSLQAFNSSLEEYIVKNLKNGALIADTISGNSTLSNIYYNQYNKNVFPLLIMVEDFTLINNKPKYTPKHLIATVKDNNNEFAYFLSISYNDLIKVLGKDKVAKTISKRKYKAKPMAVIDINDQEAFAGYQKEPMINKNVAHELIKE